MADIYSVLITGASRGIGLEFVKQFLTNPLVRTEIVIAACRSPQKATDLQELKKKYTSLHILKLDVTKFDTFDSLVNEVQTIVGDNGLTLLINNAGIGSPQHKLDTVKAEYFISVLMTNTVGPVMLTKALRPLLKQSAQINATKHDSDLRITRAAVINISSLFGSIKLTGSDERFKEIRAYGYRESKAALNMATQSLSLELREDGILVESIDPGFVITDLTAKMRAQITTETSVTSMLKVMLDLKEKHKNGFCSFNGEVLPF